MEELSQSGFNQGVPTIACGNMSIPDVDKDSQLVVQVTRTSVIAVNLAFAQRVAEWKAPGTITVASVNDTQVCLATKGGRLFVLSMMEDGAGEAFTVVL